MAAIARILKKGQAHQQRRRGALSFHGFIARLEQGSAKTAVFAHPLWRSPQLSSSPSASKACGASPARSRPGPGDPGQHAAISFKPPKEAPCASASMAHSTFIANFEQGPAKTAVFMRRLLCPLHAARMLDPARWPPPHPYLQLYPAQPSSYYTPHAFPPTLARSRHTACGTRCASPRTLIRGHVFEPPHARASAAMARLAHPLRQRLRGR